MNGLSLAMNSANSETKNRTRKIQSETKPRRLALKFAQRRRLIGESVKRPRAGGTGGPTGVGGGAAGALPVWASILRLPAFRNRYADRSRCRSDRTRASSRGRSAKRCRASQTPPDNHD